MKIAAARAGYVGLLVALLPNSWSDGLTKVADRAYMHDLFRKG